MISSSIKRLGVNKMSAVAILLYVICASLGLIAIKLGTTNGLPISIASGKLDFNINFYALLGILMYGLSFIVYLFLISRYNLGYIIPLTTALVYIIIFFASFTLFKEEFTIYKIIGITFIVVGLIMLNIGKSSTEMTSTQENLERTTNRAD